MEQTMEQTVQGMGSSDSVSYFLAIVAAAGSVVSVITLVLTILWRHLDSRVRMTITFAVGQRPEGASETEDEGSWIRFTAVNNSSTPLFPAAAYLQAEDARQLEPMARTMPGWGVDILHPRSPAMYSYSMAKVAWFLSRGGKETASAKFIVRDGTGKHHEITSDPSGVAEVCLVLRISHK